MRLTRLRLTITPSEFKLLNPGLDLLVNGLTSASLGNFPDRYPLPHFVSSYRDRAFDPEMAQRIIDVRQKLLNLSHSHKVRLDVFEVSAAALALRLLSPRPTESGLLKSQFDALDQKLEIYRRRARRAALKRLSEAEFDDANRRWKRLVQWCRFNFLNTPKIRPATLWWRQRYRLGELIRRTLEERCYAALSESEMKRMVRLLKEEFNRGRHPVKLPELFDGRESSRRLVFTLVSKKTSLTALPGAEVPGVIAASQRAEMFNAAMARRNTTRMAARSPTPVAEAAGKPTSFTESPRIAALTNADLVAGVASWLEADVPHEHWVPVINLAAQQALNFPIILRNQPLLASTLTGVVAETRPYEHNHDLSSAQGSVCYFAGWLLSWVYVYRLSQPIIRIILKHGYDGAVKDHAPERSAA